jgi:DNA-binding NarL/FixJ family response regulator
MRARRGLFLGIEQRVCISVRPESIAMLTSHFKSAEDVSNGVVARPIARKSLVILSENGIAECLLYALEREFPALSIAQVSDVEEILHASAPPVALLLVDAAFIHGESGAMDSFIRRHPSTIVAAMFEDEKLAAATLGDFAQAHLVRSVLPMNFKLDVWLSVVGLMLKGGEYFPPSMMISRCGAAARGDGSGLRITGSPRSASPDRMIDIEALTEREFQVLELVAQGTQNKLIAAQLGLSEHTVKIHIHNVIRKLGTHNRTEAAALFHRSGTMRVAQPRRPRE